MAEPGPAAPPAPPAPPHPAPPLPVPPHRGDALLTRLGVTGVLARDTLLAGVVVVLMLGLFALAFSDATLTAELGVPDRGALVAVVCVQAALLALRRSRPVLCLALVLACQLVVVAMLPAAATVRGLPPMIAAYTVGTLLPARRALVVTGAAAAVEVVVSLLLAADAPAAPGLPSLLLGYGLDAVISYPVPALVGLSVVTRRQYLDLLRVRADEAVRAQEATARAAVVAERSRMARELHDVAAHHLSGMVVQAAAVERLVDRDPAAARAGAAWLRTQGKATLDDLRAVVGVLREGAEDGTAPVPGLGDLDALVGTARDLGADVTLTRAGPDVPLGPLADAALYRVAQQALANARQHAPGAPAAVALRTDDATVTLTVTNAAAPAPRETSTREGVGLIGMRERAALVGATLDAGPTPDGGWSVRVVLPRDRVGEQTAPAPGATGGDA